MKLNHADVKFAAWFPSPEQIAGKPVGSPQLVVYEFDSNGRAVWALDTKANLWKQDLIGWRPEKEVWS